MGELKSWIFKITIISLIWTSLFVGLSYYWNLSIITSTNPTGYAQLFAVVFFINWIMGLLYALYDKIATRE